MKQKQFYFPQFEAPTLVHGGEHSVGKRKSRRPLSTKKPLHVVMRSSRAKGRLSLRGNGHEALTKALLHRYAKMFSIRVYGVSVNSNHIHLALKAKTRLQFQNFLRAFAGNLALKILKAKGEAGKFWDLLAFSRVSEWGSGFKTLLGYIRQNVLEASGLIAYKQRKPTRLKKQNRMVANTS